MSTVTGYNGDGSGKITPSGAQTVDSLGNGSSFSNGRSRPPCHFGWAPLTAFEDNSAELPDLSLLERTEELGRVLFTQDHDIFVIAAALSMDGRAFPGIVFLEQQRTLIGQAIDDLQILAEALEPEEIAGEVIYLPL